MKKRRNERKKWLGTADAFASAMIAILPGFKREMHLVARTHYRDACNAPSSEDVMAKTTTRQRKSAGRVMHEFKHGELKSGRGGKGGKVKSRRQAIAIALKESGASKYESARTNKRNLAKTKRKESRGETYQQEAEGKSRIGARGRRESSRTMAGRNAKSASRKRSHAGARSRSNRKSHSEASAHA
jgi:hypothetical protein